MTWLVDELSSTWRKVKVRRRGSEAAPLAGPTAMVM